MHSSAIFSVLCAATALAGPVLNQRNMAPHQHNHMDFHLHKERDTGADEMLNFLESAAPAGEFPPAGANNPTIPPPPANSPPPAPEEKLVVITVTDLPAAISSAPPKPAAKAAPAKAAPVPPPKVQEKISGPPVAQHKPAPAQPASPSPPSGGNMPSAPTTFEESMTSEDQAYKDLVLVHHNIHRANHSVPLLEWNETLYETAKQSAQSCYYAHTSPIPPYGQNIAAGNAPGNVSADITNGFYNGEIGLFEQAIGEFGNSSPDMADFEHWGHATQMLWKETTSVGCYTAICSPPGADPEACNPSGQSYLPPLNCLSPGTIPVKAYFLVCDYYPPGNYPNSYNSVQGPNGEKPFVEMTANGVTGL